MNEYQIADMNIGMSANFQVELTAKMMKQFMLLTGDNNPLHIDGKYAKSKGFSEKVVYGMLTSSLFSRLVGVYLPGKHCLLQGIDSVFLKPAYVGDILDINGVVSYINEPYKMIEIKANITNQFGTKTSRAKIKVGFL
jgi:acyl dehydratase